MRLDEINYLLRLSGSKLTLLEVLLESTKEQSEILNSEQEEKIEASLRKRQDIIKKIDILDNEFLIKYTELKSELGVNSLLDYKEDLGQELRALQNKIFEILKITEKIQELDNSNREKFEENMKKVQEGIRTIRNSKKVTAGYKAYQSQAHSIFLDKKR
ncbi:MAG: flagellar protein FlgN [Clostridiales bacterium]|nr:flagellar protein FlgN [Clostridiales bacterium]